jgi:hypothetical protein
MGTRSYIFTVSELSGRTGIEGRILSQGLGSCHHLADTAWKSPFLFGRWVRINLITEGGGWFLNTIIILHYIHNTRMLKDCNITVALGRHTVSTDIAETSLRGLLSPGVATLILTLHVNRCNALWANTIKLQRKLYLFTQYPDIFRLIKSHYQGYYIILTNTINRVTHGFFKVVHSS